MKSFILKTAVYFGDDALSHLSEIGYDKVFIIADPFTVESGLINAATKYLDAAKIRYTVYSDVEPDPSSDKVVGGVAALLSDKAPCLITIGGGSAIDLAKCIRQFAHKIDPSYSPYFIAIPTTSGTGSEVTSFAVITDTEAGIKHAIVDDYMLPDEAILDVEMVKTVPARITADTGMDVMTHAIEAYASRNSNEISSVYARKATLMCKEYLLRSYNFASTGDAKARARMHLASNFAGIAFNVASLGLTHSMAHQLGAQFHLPHGRANAMLLPVIIAYNSGIDAKTAKLVDPNPCVAKYARLSRSIGLGSFNDVESVKALIAYIRYMLLEMEVPNRISEALPNLTREEYMSKIPTMTEAALADTCTPTNPRTPTASEVAAIFERLW